MILEGGESAYQATMDVIATFSQGKTPEVLMDKEFIGSIWDEPTWRPRTSSTTRDLHRHDRLRVDLHRER